LSINVEVYCQTQGQIYAYAMAPGVVYAVNLTYTFGHRKWHHDVISGYVTSCDIKIDVVLSDSIIIDIILL